MATKLDTADIIKRYMALNKRIYISDERDWPSLVKLLKGFGIDNYQLARLFDVFILADQSIYEVVAVDPSEGTVITNAAYQNGLLNSEWLK